MCTIEELDAAVLLTPVFGVERHEMLANALDAFGRRKFVVTSVEAKVGPRDDEFVDLVGLKMFEQRGNIIIRSRGAPILYR